MSTEYRLSYTAAEIDEKLGKVDNLVSSVNGVMPDINGNVEITIPDSGNNTDMSQYVTKDEIPNTINAALAEAKASGGFDGENGYSPTATVTQTADGASINITDKNGTTTATIVNGKDGVDGKDGSSTRNLLINSDFRNPVNQKGQTSYIGTVYGIDRWYGRNNTSVVSVQANGINVTGDRIIQKIDAKNIKPNTVYTLSAMRTDGNIDIFASTFESGSPGLTGTVIFIENGSYLVRLDSGYTYIWSALYEGEYTLETLPEYQSKGYEQELLICRQYDTTTGEYIGLRKFGQPRNLLDNSDFTNPVNQRGQTSYTNSDASKMTYAVDRWKFIHGTFTVNDGYINYASTKGATYKRIVHVLNKTLKAGKSYTIAVRARVNEVGNFIRLRPCTSSYGTISGASQLDIKSKTNNFETFLVSFTLANDAVNPGFDLLCFNTANDFVNIDIEWAAFYEGEYTAETLPEYQPKGYAVEFAECCRYAYAIGRYNMMSGFITGSDKEIWTTVFSPVPMRIREPSFELYPNVIIRTINGYSNLTPNTNSPITPTNMLCNSEKVNNGQIFRIRFYFDSAIGANNTPATVFFDSGFVISADL